MNIKYVMIVGLHNYEAAHNADGLGEYNADVAIKSYMRTLASLCGGCTLTEGTGGYVMDSGTLVTERVAILTVIDMTGESDAHIASIARQLCLEFKEECVLLEEVDIHARFVRGE